MSSDLTQKELLEEKENLEAKVERILYFQNKSNILTMRMDDYLKATGCSISIIPNSFINQKNKTPEPRRPLYVFDFIGVHITNGVYPAGMDRDMFEHFMFIVDEALNKSGLSSRMIMDEEQRRIFDFLVREQSKTKADTPQILTSDEWYRMIRRRIYHGIPQQIEQILNKRNLGIVMELTRYVRTKCSNVRLSDSVIEQFLNEALNANNITINELRHFDINEFRRDNRGKIR